MKQVSKKTAFGGGLAVAGATQLSRNKKIRAVGGVALYAVVMGAIGELLGFIIKWLVWEPAKAICKISWACTVFVCKTSWRLTVILFTILKTETIKLIKYINTKYIEKKTV